MRRIAAHPSGMTIMYGLKHRDNILKNYKGNHKYTCILAPALEDAI